MDTAQPPTESASGESSVLATRVRDMRRVSLRVAPSSTGDFQSSI
jgi:hypothetical protein